MAQWFRTRLPMQRTRVWSLLQKSPHAAGATKAAHRKYWACALESGSCNQGAHVLKPLKPMHPRACDVQQVKPLQWEVWALQPESSPCWLQLVKAHVQWWTPNIAKNKQKYPWLSLSPTYNLFNKKKQIQYTINWWIRGQLKYYDHISKFCWEILCL